MVTKAAARQALANVSHVVRTLREQGHLGPDDLKHSLAILAEEIEMPPVPPPPPAAPSGDPLARLSGVRRARVEEVRDLVRDMHASASNVFGPSETRVLNQVMLLALSAITGTIVNEEQVDHVMRSLQDLDDKIAPLFPPA